VKKDTYYLENITKLKYHDVCTYVYISRVVHFIITKNNHLLDLTACLVMFLYAFCHIISAVAAAILVFWLAGFAVFDEHVGGARCNINTVRVQF
jgi:hypothetical protein